MSGIYFHSEHGEARISGSERAHAGLLCNDLMIAALGGDLEYSNDWLMKMIPTGSYAHTAPKMLKTYLRSYNSVLVIDDAEHSSWHIGLNTALALGNDSVRLLARLHAQCEIHCYVEGENRKWLADIIRDGRRTNILREGMFWEAAIELLESRDDGPVVCSYSVCEQFPDFIYLPDDHPLKLRDDDDRWDDFYDLPEEEKWAACMIGLRSTNDRRELKPDGWKDFHFGAGLSAFDVVAEGHSR